jgi:hypothetical protein
MGTHKESKTDVVNLAQQLLAGTKSKLAGGPLPTLAGREYTAAELIASLEEVIALRAAVGAAKAEARARLAEEEARMPELRALMSALVQWVKVTRAGQNEVLAAFGIQPKVRAPLTVEAQVAAVAKRAATRKARHTMGPVAKRRIKGDVVGVTVTPVVAGPSSVTVATPAAPHGPPTDR